MECDKIVVISPFIYTYHNFSFTKLKPSVSKSKFQLEKLENNKVKHPYEDIWDMIFSNNDKRYVFKNCGWLLTSHIRFAWRDLFRSTCSMLSSIAGPVEPGAIGTLNFWYIFWECYAFESTLFDVPNIHTGSNKHTWW